MRLDGKNIKRWPSRRKDMMRWLQILRDVGPAQNLQAQQSMTGRAMGLTDWYVRDKRTGRWKGLQKVKASLGPGERLLDVVDYGEGRECLTDLGRKTLEQWESDAKKAD